MNAVLESISTSLYNGVLPKEWAKLAPETRKNLASWMDHFEKRIQQYTNWVLKYFIAWDLLVSLSYMQVPCKLYSLLNTLSLPRLVVMSPL